MKQTAASVASLVQIKNVDENMAKIVRKVWRELTREQLIEEFPHVAAHVRRCVNPPDTIILRQMAVDAVIGTFGVEYLGTSRKTGEHVCYCNSGDTYDTTVIFSGPRLWVGCWGDLIERKSVKEVQSW